MIIVEYPQGFSVFVEPGTDSAVEHIAGDGFGEIAAVLKTEMIRNSEAWAEAHRMPNIIVPDVPGVGHNKNWCKQ